MIEMTWSSPAPQTPATHLTYIERLLVHALRQWAANKSRWPEVVLEFNRACGPRAATAVCEALESAFHHLGIHARRRIRLHRPVCCLVSPDEVCLLNLIAARQVRDEMHARALANWLVPMSFADVLVSDIDRIANGLGDGGYTLQVRASPACPHACDTGAPRLAIH